MQSGAFPKGTAAAAFRQLFPVTRVQVDESDERLEDVKKVLVENHLPIDNVDKPLKWSKYAPQAPEIKQQAALSLDDTLILMFGGAGGGGKSTWGLQGALQYVDTPGYSALILRRSFAELTKAGSLMDRAREWLAPTDAVFRGRDNKFVFPSGAQLEFGYLARDADVHQFQSAEYQYIFFDELTAFSEFSFRYMVSRVRRLEGSNVPLRVRAATNPGGPGHEWVRRAFPVDGSGPNEEGWAFIPALVDDNPNLDREQYKKGLEMLDPYTRAQMLHGDWNVRPPGNWAYDRDHLDAAVNLGLRLDKQYEDGTLKPAGEKQYLGVDFGELSAVLIGWPLEGGGWYIADEHVWGDEGNKSEPDVEAYNVIEKLDALGPYTLDKMRFDAARPESQRLMGRTFKNERGTGYGTPSKISFAKYKRAAVRHLRALVFRSWVITHAEDDVEMALEGCLGISVRCPKLAACLYKMERVIEDPDQLVKFKDDENDALLALIAPDIKKHSKLGDAPTPDEVQSRLARVQEAAESARRALFGLSSG